MDGRPGSVVLEQAGGSILLAVRARDAHVVPSPGNGRADALQDAPRRDRTLEIAFLEPGAEADAFTFG
jgi:hypothetical protein